MDVVETGEEVDRLITTDVGARGVIRKLYSAARFLNPGPLCLEAAKRLVERVKRGDTVFILTGFPVLPNLLQETDGPIGAAAMARGVSQSIGATPILVTEDCAVDCTKSALLAMELSVVEADLARSGRTAAVVPFPTGLEAAKAKADLLLREFNPSAVVAIEKVAPNTHGIYHTMRGFDVSGNVGKVDLLVDLARRARVLTVGIGDGGNEIGMGNIVDEVRRSVPNGSKCQCACGGGIAAVTKADLLVPASVSNWGGHGIEACIDLLQDRVETVHSGEVEKACISACVAAGGVDGISGSHQPSVDGLSAEINASIVDVLRTMVCNSKR